MVTMKPKVSSIPLRKKGADSTQSYWLRDAFVPDTERPVIVQDRIEGVVMVFLAYFKDGNWYENHPTNGASMLITDVLSEEAIWTEVLI
jgi:hypothetical protein